MVRRGLNNLVAVLTIVAYGVTSLLGGPGNIVLCHGADGHLAIEPVHPPSGCSGGFEAGGAKLQRAAESGGSSCRDMLLASGIPQVQSRAKPDTAGRPCVPLPSFLVCAFGEFAAPAPLRPSGSPRAPNQSLPLLLRTVVLLI